MPLVAGVVCPHPPLLVPEVASGAAVELDELRESCDAAVARLVAKRPDLIIVVGDSPVTTAFGPGDKGTFRRFGLPLTVMLPGGRDCLSGPEPERPAVLPLSLAIGAFLLDRTPPGCPVTGQGVSGQTSPAGCASLGRQLVTTVPPGGGRVGLLIVGDGTAARDERGREYTDPRAETFDARVTKAFADADPGALLDLDPLLATELMAAGRAPWQVLAGAAADRTATDGVRWRGEVRYDAAPYGVRYLVAVWEPA